MQSKTINFIVPQGWHELTDRQLHEVYSLIADNFTSDELKVLCLLRWSGTKVIGKQVKGVYLLQQGNTLFEVTPTALAELLPHLDWLDNPPSVPVRISKIGKHSALPADFQGVPFETYICVDNLYQGYLHTQDDNLLDELAIILYPGLNLKRKTLKSADKVAIFYWLASLKTFFSQRFPDFLQPTSSVETNLLGGSPNIGKRLQDAMDAQIRALTQGDVTKEKIILSLDTWRSLTELNAQAREYHHLQPQLKK